MGVMQKASEPPEENKMLKVKILKPTTIVLATPHQSGFNQMMMTNAKKIPNPGGGVAMDEAALVW